MSRKKQARSDYGPQRITPLTWILLLLAAAGALLVPVLLSLDITISARYTLSRFAVGQLSDEDVYATSSFEYLDKDRTDYVLGQAERGVLPIFSYSLENTLVSTRRMEEFAQIWLSAKEGEDASAQAAAEELLKRENLTDTQQVVERYLSLGTWDRSLVAQLSRETMRKVLDGGLYSDSDLNEVRAGGWKQITVDGMPGNPGQNVTESVDSLTTKTQLEKDMSDFLSAEGSSPLDGYQLMLLEDTIRLLAVENIRYNADVTLLMRQQARAATSPIYVSVEKGQKILEKDKVITQSQISLLEEMARHRTPFTWSQMAGRLFFALLVMSCAVVTFLMFLPHSPRKYQYLRFALIAVIVGEIVGYFTVTYTTKMGFTFRSTCVPYLFAPLFIAALSGRQRYGICIAFITSAFTLLLPGAGILTFFSCLAVCLSCIYFFQHSLRRVDTLYHWLYACLVSVFAEAILGLGEGYAVREMMPLCGNLILNITVTELLVSVLVSICETAFNLPTAARLNELTFGQLPLIDKLQSQAVGTYNHSVNVSEMSYDVAKSIGVNAMLARAGGLYHDIGKMDYPEYFVENQGDENKQDDLKPSLSVAIIKSHVKTGVEKGREAGLPLEILDIIASHHGNDVIRFFYRKAKDIADQEKDGIVNQNDYRYDAPLPSSKEAGIVMICDSVEAASHTVQNPSPVRFEKLVHAIIMEKIEHGQLKKSRLSLTDLDTIEKTLTKNLIGRNHHRIEYPKEDVNALPAEEQGPSEEPKGESADDEGEKYENV